MFEIAIKLDENVYTRLFDNGIEMSEEDITAIQMAIREGTVFPESYKEVCPLSEEEIFRLLNALSDNKEEQEE